MGKVKKTQQDAPPVDEDDAVFLSRALELKGSSQSQIVFWRISDVSSDTPIPHPPFLALSHATRPAPSIASFSLVLISVRSLAPSVPCISNKPIRVFLVCSRRRRRQDHSKNASPLISPSAALSHQKNQKTTKKTPSQPTKLTHTSQNTLHWSNR